MREALSWLLLVAQVVALAWLGVEISRVKEAQRSVWAMARELEQQHREVDLILARSRP